MRACAKANRQWKLWRQQDLHEFWVDLCHHMQVSSMPTSSKHSRRRHVITLWILLFVGCAVFIKIGLTAAILRVYNNDALTHVCGHTGGGGYQMNSCLRSLGQLVSDP